MGSFAQGALIEQKTSTTNSNGTTNLTVSSTTLQRFIGSDSQTAVLPNATTLLAGRYFIIENESNETITINYYGGTFAAYIASGTQRRFDLFDIATTKGGWVVGNQVELEGPLALHATRPAPDNMLNIASNQVKSSSGSVLSVSPVDDVLTIYPDTYIDMAYGVAAGGIYGGDVLTQGLTFTRPNVTIGRYVRLVFTYISMSNKLNTKFSSEAINQSSLENPGTLFASIDGLPIGYIDLKSTASYIFCTANTTSGNVIENYDIVKFSAGAGAGGAGDKSFKFQSIAGSLLTVKAGYLILNDGRELYAPADFTIDLSTVASIDGDYYGYIDSSLIPVTPSYFNGRKLFQITSSQFAFSTITPDLINLIRYIPIGCVQRSSGVWQNQQSTALRRHDNVVLGVDASLEYSQAYTTVGNVGDLNQIKAGHLLDSGSFPSSISSANISWYGLTSGSDSSTNGRNLTSNGSPVFTDTNILGVANCFAPDGLNDYLSSTNSFFAPSTATNFAFGCWFKADNYSLASIQAIISNWGSGTKSYKLQLNSGSLEFVTSTNGILETTTFLYNATTLSGWNQIVVSHTSSGVFYFYLNGSLLLFSSLAIFASSSVFNIAAADGLNYFAGSIDEFFFINGSYLIQDDVSKLYATKITHNRSMTPTNQKWYGFSMYGDIEREIFNFTVDINTNILYANFSTHTSTAQIALKMYNAGTIGASKPIKSKTLELTAAQLDALIPLTHYLYDVPFLRLQVDESGTGNYATHDDSSYFTVTNSQIVSTGVTLSSIVPPSTMVRFTYSIGGESINARRVGQYIIVGDSNIPDADYSDLWSALTATQTIPGSRILVMTDQSTSIARTISNSNVYVEFLPGKKIISTVGVGTAITITGSLTTYNMTIDFQGNANGLSFSGSASIHNNLYLKVSGIVTSVVSFAAGAIRNRIIGVVEVTGTVTNVVSDSSTTQSNMWSLSNGSKVYESSNYFHKFYTVGTTPNADYTDLWTALAAVPTNSRLLVLTDQSTSVARAISNSNTHIEFMPGVKIVSTSASGIAITITDNLTTYNMTIDLQGNVTTGLRLSGSASNHNNFYLKVSTGVTVTNGISFATSAIRNRINGAVEIVGTLTNIVSDSSTTQSNMWSLSTGSIVLTETGYKQGSMRTTEGYARISSPTQSIRAAGTESLDCSTQHIFYKTGGTATITLSNFVEGQTVNLILRSTGSAYTVTWSPAIIWGPSGIPTPTATSSKYDFYTFIKIGSLIFGTVVLAMA